MNFRNELNSLRGLVLNIGLVLVLILLLSFTFFYKVMPDVTNHRKIVTVPDLRGMTNEEAVRFLKARQLQYEFGDSIFRADTDPLVVLDQYPEANSKVKIYRKIKLTLNATTAPLVAYPDLNGYTYQFAKQQLESLGLSVGKYSYESDIALNAVLESRLVGKKLSAGQSVPKGTTVELVIGMPDLEEPDNDSIGISQQRNDYLAE
jgi:beta-lactam-binding protein with PASTA domain